MSNPNAQAPHWTRLPATARRCPPERSVSLRQAPKRQGIDQLPQLPHPPRTASAASSLINNRDSSGESSNVDNWFERSNNNLDKDTHTRLANNEPPFFLQNNSSSGSPPTNTHGASTTFPAKLLHSTGSSSEEYRSVIDDLTIQNKRLRERLRRYEQNNSPHLQSEQLFELRVHGLPADKKRRLEDLLRGFTQSLTAPSKPDSNNKSETSRYASVTAKPTSSMTSTRFAADSGYGSMTTPNQASASKSFRPTAGSTAASGSQSGLLSTSEVQAKDSNIQSYLRDTSSSLLPNNSAGLSDRARKKLVVLRLEQIFGGRGVLPESTDQPAQQQELSQIAARDDRTALGAMTGLNNKEGTREARIMSANLDNTSPNDTGASSVSRTHAFTRQDSASEAVEKSPYPEQRPTRPLDLDPYRALIPSDNIEYIRHLGFNMIDYETREVSAADSEGWIYVNLLFNMAQLHTLNVTTDFAKRAVSEYSNKFELSSDGRKIRWRTNTRLDKSESASSEENENANEPSNKEARPNLKRDASALVSSRVRSAGRAPLRKAVHTVRKEKSLVYTPLFHRQSETDEDASMADYESYDSFPEGLVDALTGGAAATGGRGRQRGAGPIIFYNNAYFCTDLSGDNGTKSGSSTAVSPLADMNSHKSDFSSFTLGVDKSRFRSQSLESGETPMASTDRYFEDGAEPPAKKRVVAYQSEDIDMDFPVGAEHTARHVSFAESPSALDFEVSGLGGVVPADHLAIVVVKEIRARPNRHKGSSLVPAKTRIDKILNRSEPISPTKDRILSVRTSNLKPSVLPEPSWAFAAPDLMDDEDEDDTDESPEHAMGGGMDYGGMPNLVLLDRQPIQDELSSNADSDGSSLAAESGSQAELVDFLSTARQLDPQAVLAKEREYEAEMAERLAEEIPAGSSAATAGGGSNNGSPLEGVAKRQNMALSGDRLPRPIGDKDSRNQKSMESDVEDSDKDDDDDDNDDNDDDDDDDGNSNGTERSISS